MTNSNTQNQKNMKIYFTCNSSDHDYVIKRRDLHSKPQEDIPRNMFSQSLMKNSVSLFDYNWWKYVINDKWYWDYMKIMSHLE